MQQRVSGQASHGDAMSEEARAYSAGRARGAEFSEYNVIAEYEDMGAAKKAIDALELAGVDPVEYALLGATVAEAEAEVDAASIRETDRRALTNVTHRAMKWGGSGLVAGAVIGAILSAIPGWPLADPYSVVVGVIVLGIAGALVGAMTTLESGPQVDVPYRPVGHEPVLVGVRSDDSGHVQHAERVLEREHPMALHHYDRRGNLQT